MIKQALVSLSILGLVACSGGNSGSGKASPSALTEYDVAIAAVETTQSTVYSSDRPDINVPTLFSRQAARASDSSMSLPVGAVELFENEVVYGQCGGLSRATGSISYSDNPQNPFPMVIDYSVTYDEYCSYDGIIDGYAQIDMMYESQTKGHYSVEMDITATGVMDYYQGRYKYAVRCTIDGADEQCVEGAWHLSASGYEMQLVDFEVDGDEFTGYDVSGTIQVEGQNRYTVSARHLTSCENGNFSTGELTVYENGQLYLAIEFLNCSEFLYTTAQGLSEVVAY